MSDTPLVHEAHKLSVAIPISDIFVGARRRKDYGNLDELAKDLQDNGQITAITVAPPSEDALSDPEYSGQPWVLVAGGRRLAAAQRAGWIAIRALDREHLDPLKLRVLELAENVQRKDMSFLEQVQAKAEMLELRRQQDPDITQAEVARELGETPANFSRDINVFEAINARPELRTASSKKAVLRAASQISHLEARVARSVAAQTSGQGGIVGNLMNDLASRMVTADARLWLRQQPEGKYSLILTDPPYGIDHFSQGHKTREGVGSGMSEYDDSEAVSLDLYADMVPQMVRATSEVGWIMCFQAEANYDFLKKLFEDCCTTHYEYRVNHENGQCPAYYAGGPSCRFGKVEEPRWIWYRPNSQNNPRLPELHAKNLYEHILVYNRGQGRLLRTCGNVLSYEAEYGSRIHSMQKPPELLKDLISRVTLPGDTVADPFFGSGSTLHAAAQLARDFWGCEQNASIREPAMGYVSQVFDGVAPKAAPLELVDFDENDEMEELSV